MTVNFVTGEDSWTLVQRRKKNKTNKNNKNEKWNAQQKHNFVRYGDIYQLEPYKSHRNVDIGPPLAIAQPQQQVAQQPAAPTLSPNRTTIHSAAASGSARLSLWPQPHPNSSHLRSSSLRRCRSCLHQLAENVTDSRQFRPFQKKTNHSRRTALDSPTHRRHPLLPPVPTHLTISIPRPAHQIKLSEKEEQRVKTFLQLFDIWPFQRMQTFDNAEARYRLTREEKEQLKFLGLQNFFNTTWPKPDPHHRGPGRWKKN